MVCWQCGTRLSAVEQDGASCMLNAWRSRIVCPSIPPSCRDYRKAKVKALRRCALSLVECCEYFSCRSNGSLDLRVPMCRGYKPGLVRGGCEIDAVLEHGVEEAAEAFTVARHDLRVICRRRSAEKDAEHAAQAGT